MKFKEPFIASIESTYEWTAHRGRVQLLEVVLGFYMMEREDNKRIIYQNSLGTYNETTRARIIKLSDKDLVEKLENEIGQRYDVAIGQYNKLKESHLIEIDKYIGKKSVYIEQLQDLAKKQDENGLNDNQLKSYTELRKAVKRVGRRLYSHEQKISEYDAKIDGLELDKATSIERMKRLIKTLNRK